MTCLAVTTVGSLRTPLCIRAVDLISSHMSSLLLLAAPSVPRATESPESIISLIGAIPLPSLRLLPGLWTTVTALEASSGISSLGIQTPWARMSPGTERRPDLSR